MLDLTIAEAIARRSADFAGVTVCSPNDSLANIIRYIGERRVHRFVIVDDGLDDDKEQKGEDDDDDDASTPVARRGDPLAAKGARAKRRGRLVGMLTLSDIMRYIVGVEQKTVAGVQIVGLGLNGEGATPTQTGRSARTTVTVTSAADTPSTTVAATGSTGGGGPSTAEEGVDKAVVGGVTATPTETSAAAVVTP